ncbi:MAG: ORC1-type DNA replication protein [Sulfolobales archaeon]
MIDPRRIIEEAVSKPSVFIKKEALYPEYIPRVLPHRENQMTQLARYFRNILASPGSSSTKVLVVGGVGTGKTVTTRFFGKEFRELALEKGLDVRYVHINCHRSRTLYEILTELIKELNAPIPTRGFSARELLKYLHEYVERTDLYVIVTLDEFNYFVETSGPDAVYFLMRVYDEYPDWSKRLNYILISRDYSVLHKIDLATYDYVMKNIVKFNPYRASELRDILIARREEAFHRGTVSDEIVSYIAELEGYDTGGSGNARAAIETLLLAGEAADQENSPVVKIDHVRKARSYINSDIVVISEALQYLNLHELLLLKAVVEILNREGSPYVSMGRVEEEYRRLANMYSLEPRKHTQVYEYVNNLKKMGIIEAKLSSKGRRGRTTMIGIGGVPLKPLADKINELVEKLIVVEIKRTSDRGSH